jgi:hypothetical protein
VISVLRALTLIQGGEVRNDMSDEDKIEAKVFEAFGQEDPIQLNKFKPFALQCCGDKTGESASLVIPAIFMSFGVTAPSSAAAEEAPAAAEEEPAAAEEAPAAAEEAPAAAEEAPAAAEEAPAAAEEAPAAAEEAPAAAEEAQAAE